MILLRILVILLIAIIAVVLVSRLLRWIIKRILFKKLFSDLPLDSAQPMVECNQCGTFVPKEQALEHKGFYYCCKKHMES